MTVDSEHHSNLNAVVRPLEDILYKRHNLMPMLRNYSPESIARMRHLFFDEEGYRLPSTGLHLALAGIVHGNASQAFLDEFLAYAPALGYKSEMNLVQCISGLHYYRSQGWVPQERLAADHPRALSLSISSKRITDFLSLSEEDDDNSAEIRNPHPLLHSIDGAEGGYPNRVLNNEALVRLLWDRAADDIRIVRIVKERGDADPEMLLSVLGSASVSLSEGAL